MDIRLAFIQPFLDAIPIVLQKPLGKRLPKGFNFGNKRNGFCTIQRFCFEWQALCSNWPGIIQDSDYQAMEPVFELKNKLFPET